MNRRSDDTYLSRTMNEARRWATVVLIILVAWLSYQVSTLGSTVDSIKDSSSRTEIAADELVGFVHEIQAQQSSTSSSGGQSQVVQLLINLLCASSDPARQQACATLNPQEAN